MNAEDFFASAEFRARKAEPEAYLGCLARLGAAAEARSYRRQRQERGRHGGRRPARPHLYRTPAELEGALKLEGFRDVDLN